MKKQTLIYLAAIAGLGLVAYFLFRRRTDSSDSAPQAQPFSPQYFSPKKGDEETPATETPAPTTYNGYDVAKLEAAAEGDYEAWLQRLTKKGLRETPARKKRWFRRWLAKYAEDNPPDV